MRLFTTGCVIGVAETHHGANDRAQRKLSIIIAIWLGSACSGEPSLKSIKPVLREAARRKQNVMPIAPQLRDQIGLVPEYRKFIAETGPERAENECCLLPVDDGYITLGHLVEREQAFEAVQVDGRSLGVFSTADAAAAALVEAETQGHLAF